MRVLCSLLVTVACGFGAGELSGRRAPGFSLQDSSFKQHDLQDYRGKIVVLEFLQINCPHCAAFAPILEEISKKYRGKVEILSIVNPPSTDPKLVQKFKAENKVTTPFLFDCGQVGISYFKATPEHSTVDVPHIFLIDAGGAIRNDFGYGPATKDIFEGKALFAELDRMLAAGSKEQSK